MPTYNASSVSDAVIAFRKPITLQQGRALRDNPLAIAAGSAGAPYSQEQWHPFNSIKVGDGGSGRVWSFAVEGAVASIDSPDFDEGYEYRLRFDRVSATGLLRINVYRNTSAAYAGPIQLIRVDGTTTINSNASGYLILSRAGIASHYHDIPMALREAPALDSLIGANGNSERIAGITHTVEQRLLRVQLTPVSGTFLAGAIYMDRRRVYA